MEFLCIWKGNIRLIGSWSKYIKLTLCHNIELYKNIIQPLLIIHRSSFFLANLVFSLFGKYCSGWCNRTIRNNFSLTGGKSDGREDSSFNKHTYKKNAVFVDDTWPKGIWFCYSYSHYFMSNWNLNILSILETGFYLRSLVHQSSLWLAERANCTASDLGFPILALLSPIEFLRLEYRLLRTICNIQVQIISATTISAKYFFNFIYA